MGKVQPGILTNTECVEKHNGRVVEVVDETNGPEGDVEDVLSMVVHEHTGEVLLAHLWSFCYT